jgi:hypothetical protein
MNVWTSKSFKIAMMAAVVLIGLGYLLSPAKSQEVIDQCITHEEMVELNSEVQFITTLSQEDLITINTVLYHYFMTTLGGLPDTIEIFDAGHGDVFVVYYVNSCFISFEIVPLFQVEDVLGHPLI